MYPINKLGVKTAQTTSDDCFAEKTKNWIWLLGAVVAGTMIFGVARLVNGPVPHTVPRANTLPAKNIVLESSVPIQSLAMQVNTLPNPKRVIIHSVYGWGPARGAGLQVGDRIYRFNGSRVRSLDHFKSLVARAGPRGSVPCQVIRRGKRIRSVITTEPGRI